MAKSDALHLSINIGAKVDKSLMNALKSVNGQMGSLTKAMSAVGTAGLAAMGTLAVGTVKALAQCTDAAMEFESSMADVVKYVDGLADSTGKISDKLADNGKTYAQNYDAMKGAILDLSTQIPYTADELTKLAAAAGQSGKAIDDLIQFDDNGNVKGFLKDVAMVGTALDIDAQQAGDWAAKWEVALNMSHDEIMVLFDQINYLGANSATTAAEIANAVNAAASLGQIGGVDVATTVALADAMLATGVSSNRVGTSIKRMVTNLSKGENATKAQKELWEELGFTATGVAKSMQKDATGTLTAVFEAIKGMPKERQVAALSTLFGQWAIEGGAKIVNNLDAYTKALNMVGDPSQYTGSMEREFIIKASTAENIDQMMESAKYAMQVDIGEAFLPAKKELSVALIDFMNRLRNMPELGQAAETLAGLFASGVEKAGEALEKAMPHIQKGLDYIANNGPKVISVLGKLAGVFAAMKFSPAIAGALGGVGNLVFGSAGIGESKRTGGLLGGVKSLFQGGQAAGATAANAASGFLGAAKSNGFFKTMGATISSVISGNGIKGTGAMLNTAAGSKGMLSSFQGIRAAIGNKISGSGAGQYLGGIGSAIGNLGSTIANTPLGQKALGGLGQLATAAKTKVAGLGAAAIINGNTMLQGIANSGVGQAVGGALGKAKGLAGGIANSGAVKAVGGVMSNLGGVAKAGAGVLGSVWGPVASGFGSIFAGAAPVIGVISAIIAVVSILGDHLDDIRTIVGNVFGEQGLAVFDSFMGALTTVKDFIVGLFSDGGVANALAPVRDAITNLFGEKAGAAFDGLTQILQSVMGVVGQVVDFAVTYVKPIIQDIFSFITGTVIPIIMQTFTAAAPYISAIISNVGGAIMTVMTYIAQAIQAVMPFIQGIISTIMTVGSVVVPALLAGIAAFTEQLGPVLEGIKTVFGGIIDFITGVFSGNWEQAWQGIKDIFGGIFETLEALFKAPVNAVIALINKAISGINGLGITIPDWVPIIGGKGFSINIPEIPMLAKGGFTTGPSLAGEAGREAVISFQSGVRAQNIDTWMQAGRMLGVNGNQAATAAGLQAVSPQRNAELKDIGPKNDKDDNKVGTPPPIVYAPQITIQGNADKATVEEALEEAQARFEQWYDQMMRRRQRTQY
ncbi:MAG: phage tail tape measure protein [Muribaculaceae bacterium]|nr:phage tail tape measure protein [Muribaculaceae bacterium]MCM1439333.1 phage tail tape measure protein [Roseburia sp.]